MNGSPFLIAIQNKDIRLIRIMMKDSMLVDPTFNEFNRMTQRVKDIPGMYDDHDGREFENDKSKWDDDYVAREMVRKDTFLQSLSIHRKLLSIKQKI